MHFRLGARPLQLRGKIFHLQRPASYGVAVHRYTEPHQEVDDELVPNILLALLSWLAKVEAQKISERARAGMARAKAKASGKANARLHRASPMCPRSQAAS